MPRKSKNKVIEKFMKFYFLKNILIDISMIIIGFIYLTNPYTVTRTYEIILSIILIISGLSSVFEGTANKMIPMLTLNVIYGIVSCAIASFIIINPISISRILVISFGIWLIITGLVKIFYASYLKEKNENSWPLSFVIGIVNIIFGLLLSIYNFDVTLTLVQITGTFSILYAVLDIANNLLYRKRRTEMVRIFKK